MPSNTVTSVKKVSDKVLMACMLCFVILLNMVCANPIRLSHRQLELPPVGGVSGCGGVGWSGQIRSPGAW